MNAAVECAEHGDYKGFWDASGSFPDDWLTVYWRAACLFNGLGCERDREEGFQLA